MEQVPLNDHEKRWYNWYWYRKPTEKLSVVGTVSAQGFKTDGSTGWTGTFTNGDGDTVTVKNGIITGVA